MSTGRRCSSSCSLEVLTFPIALPHSRKLSLLMYPNRASCLIWNLLSLLGCHYRHSCYSRILRDFLLSWSCSGSWLQQVLWGYNNVQNSFMLNLEVSSIKAAMLLGSQEESLG